MLIKNRRGWTLSFSPPRPYVTIRWDRRSVETPECYVRLGFATGKFKRQLEVGVADFSDEYPPYVKRIREAPRFAYGKQLEGSFRERYASFRINDNISIGGNYSRAMTTGRI